MVGVECQVWESVLRITISTVQLCNSGTRRILTLIIILIMVILSMIKTVTQNLAKH